MELLLNVLVLLILPPPAGDFDLLPEDWAHVSAAGQDLVKQLLAYKPAGRVHSTLCLS